MSAGFVVGLTGCGPLNHASNAGAAPSGDPSSAHPTNSQTTSSSGNSLGNSRHFNGQYSFRTLDNPGDLTFNQLLGINNDGVIAGYLGSGASGHPNKGYALARTPAGFAISNENFPGSVQTQVTGLNDRGVTVGFWSDTNNANQMNDNFGFYDIGGSFHSVNFPTQSNSSPPVNQLLGVNDHQVAVGFYTDANGNAHGYTFSIFGQRFHTVRITGATSVTAAAINNSNDVAGFFTNAAGTNGFLRTGGGRVYTLAYPGASMTQALGVNDSREVAGVYTVGSGNNAVMHGFTWTPDRGFKTVDDPQGAGTTTINGVNDQGDIVGFYVDGAGNTDGFAAVPGDQNPLPGLIGAAAPTPSTSPSSSSTPWTSPSSTMSPSPSTSPTSSMSPAPSPSTSPSSTMSPAPSTSPTSSMSPSPSTSPTGTTPPQSPSPNPLQPTHF
jgi:hypothetical protein